MQAIIDELILKLDSLTRERDRLRRQFELAAEDALAQARDNERLRGLLEARPKVWWLPWTPLEVARRFHDAYEAFAPMFGYETRLDTRQFDPDSANGQLMVAVIRNVLIEQASDFALGAAVQPPEGRCVQDGGECGVGGYCSDHTCATDNSPAGQYVEFVCGKCGYRFNGAPVPSWDRCPHCKPEPRSADNSQGVK